MAHQSNSIKSGSANVSRWVIPGLIISFCAIAFYLTTQFDRVPEILKRGIQPSDFPQLILLLLIGLACLLPFENTQHNRPAVPPSVFISLALIVVFVLLTGKMPYNGKDFTEMKYLISHGQPDMNSRLTKHLSAEAKAFVLKGLDLNQDTRPTCS